MKKFIKYSLIAFTALILVGVPVGSYLIVNYYLNPQIEESVANFKKYYPQILADIKIINQDPIIPAFTFNKNAEEVMVNHISWTGDGTNIIENENMTNLRKFIDGHKGWRVDRTSLLSMSTDPILDRIDTSWLKNIENYDHWNISENPLVKSQIESAHNYNGLSKIGVFAKLPIPDYKELRYWAIANFLKLHNEGKSLQGLKTYRKLAHLSYSTSSLISSMVAVQFFNDEHYLVESLKIKKWDLIPKEKIARFKRLTWAWTGLAQLSMFDTFPQELNDYLKPENGACGAAWETATITGLQDYLEPRIPFETDYSQSVENARHTSRLFQSKCNLTAYYGFSERTPASVSNKWILGPNEGFFYTGTSLNLAKIPFVRRVAGAALLAIGIPNYARFYENPDLK